ncbi:MAG: preprotein translocase subunit SecY, partial [Candidatus Rokubacteria bacterium]|nr:preprotein translocase subunit SecY [Candidatus Rokubacteria bacterium]
MIEGLQSFQNIFKIPELKRRLLITFGLLAAYRIGAHVPTPGIDGHALSLFFDQVQGTLLGMVDLFSGGNLRRLTVFALGIMPYISASIILQLLTVVIPALERLAKEGEAGRKKITQYTRYGTILLSAVQAMGIAVGLEGMRSPDGVAIVPLPGWGFRLLTVLTLTTGTALSMWLGEQISEKGIGNGISLIIFAGIVVRLPSAVVASYTLMSTGELKLFVFGGLVAMMVLVTAAVVVMQEGQRKIPVQYAKRVVGRRIYGGQSTHIPLRVNTAGVIPVIFASSIILFPATLTRFIPHPWMQAISDALSPGRFTYTMLYAGFIIFFTYFYTAIVFNPIDLSDNMKKYGGFIPGVRPGKKTAEYIDRTLTRITLPGAVFLALISILPDFLIRWFNVPFYFGGTSLLIVVGV